MIVFIKTHGRPDRQYTRDTLLKAGYTGKIIAVIDDEDECYRDYLNLYTTDLLVFDKQGIMSKTDSGVQNPRRNVNLYAWRACEELANRFGIEEFIMADDDITGFRYRYEDNGHLKSTKLTKNIDKAFNAIFEYMRNADISAVSTGMPQMYFNKDLDNNLWKYRVPYQFVFRNNRHKMNWVSEYEEDIITAINCAKQGDYLTVLPVIQHEAVKLGSSDGGMRETYDTPSFRLAEYGHMWNPSCEQIIHYKKKWMCKIERDKAFNKLISSTFKKSMDVV